MLEISGVKIKDDADRGKLRSIDEQPAAYADVHESCVVLCNSEINFSDVEHFAAFTGSVASRCLSSCRDDRPAWVNSDS